MLNKKMISLISVIVVSIQWLSSFSYWSYDPEFSNALSWMNKNNITKYNTEVWFRPTDSLTREQAAKFFVEYYNQKLAPKETDINVSTGNEDNLLFLLTDQYLNKDLSNLSNCTFSDIIKADNSLVSYIQKSCELWLMKWTNWNFDPKSKITKAQVLAVIWRMYYWQLDENVNPWWKNYYINAKRDWITKESNSTNLDRSILRWEVALMLYRLWTNQ